jgi:hypothetical protein
VVVGLSWPSQRAIVQSGGNLIENCAEGASAKPLEHVRGREQSIQHRNSFSGREAREKSPNAMLTSAGRRAADRFKYLTNRTAAATKSA